MTTRTAPWCFSFLALAGVLAFAPHAEAQCIPGSIFCAQVNVGGSISVGGYIDVAPPPPPPMVIVQQPPPPPVYLVQPPPPPPPPMVVYQPAPPVYIQQQQPRVFYGSGYQMGGYAQPPMPVREPRFGLHAELGYMGTDRVSMGGGAVALRFRAHPAFALDLGVGTYGGQDYNGRGRVEVPLTVNGVFFFNPQDRVQVYGLLGVGVSWANVDGGGSLFAPAADTGYTYLGGQVGIGLEWRLSRAFALNTDLRGFLRSRVDGGAVPEFSEGGRSTDTSMGLYGTIGATLYW